MIPSNDNPMRIYDELMASGQFSQVINRVSRDLRNDTNNHLLYLKRGIAFFNLGIFDNALEDFERTLKIDPYHSNALFNKGLVFLYKNRFFEADLIYTEYLIKFPSDSEGWNNKGNALLGQKKLDDAIKAYDFALGINPKNLDALFNKGVAHQELNDIASAINCFQSLVSQNEDYDFGIGKLVHAKMLACDWGGIDSMLQKIDAKILQGEKAIAPFEYISICNSEILLKKCAEIYSKTITKINSEDYIFPEHSNERIRIGYVAGEFRQHATSTLLVGVLENHDKSKFDIFCFDIGWDDASTMRTRISNACTEIIDLSKLSDDEAVKKIRSQKIDILIDLTGYFGQSRPGIFSKRAASIQINYLGFPGTLGAKYVDYLIADKIIIPETSKEHYFEEVLYLPNSYQPNDIRRIKSPANISRKDFSLPLEGTLFCCLNNSFKITPDIFEIWLSIIEAVPGSHLWLLGTNEMMVKNLRKAASDRSIATERLIFSGRLTPELHMLRNQLCDLFLDTLPCNAHTTASDALVAGLPVLTCRGDTFSGRVAASLLTAVGMEELITNSISDYQALAIKLGIDTKELRRIKNKLRKNINSFPLFDTKLYTKNIELLYSNVVNQHKVAKRF